MKRFLILTVALVASLSAFSQKIAHLDRAALVKSMPESVAAEAQLAASQNEYKSAYGNLEAEYNTLVQEYQANAETWGKPILEIKVKAIQQKEQALSEFEQTASADLQEQQNILYMPIIEKADKAIADVAKENGITYVIDSGLGVLLYMGGEDIIDKVKTKLAIPLTPATPVKPAPTNGAGTPAPAPGMTPKK
jgi:outer membrane protein